MGGGDKHADDSEEHCVLLKLESLPRYKEVGNFCDSSQLHNHFNVLWAFNIGAISISTKAIEI